MLPKYMQLVVLIRLETVHKLVWGGGGFFAASQADIGVQRVLVAMATVDNPAAYTGACTLLLKPFKYSSFYLSLIHLIGEHMSL